MNHSDHTLSPACWCAPIVMHVDPASTGSHTVTVHSVRDADRLADLGITDVVVNPDVPVQREGGSTMGGENGDK